MPRLAVAAFIALLSTCYVASVGNSMIAACAAPKGVSQNFGVTHPEHAQAVLASLAGRHEPFDTIGEQEKAHTIVVADR